MRGIAENVENLTRKKYSSVAFSRARAIAWRHGIRMAKAPVQCGEDAVSGLVRRRGAAVPYRRPGAAARTSKGSLEHFSHNAG
jgi:hypothetical protein